MTDRGSTDAAELYRVLAETAPDPILTIDASSTILSANPATERVLGYEPEELVGQPLAILMPERFRVRHEAGMAHYLATGKRRIPWSGVRVAILAKSGAEVPVAISFGEFASQGQRMFSGFLRDVSKQVAAEEALLEANARLAEQAAELEQQTEELQMAMVELEARTEQAEAANRAKADFLATMSHELRTPLNAIAGYSQLLEIGVHGPITDAQRDTIQRIQRSQRHLLGLINDVLNFAKLEAGRVEYQLESVAARSIVDAVEPLVAPQIAARSLELDRTQCPDSPCVYADRDKTEQILLNLLSNSIKFTHEGGTITVFCEEQGDTVRLVVKDTGIGISRDHLREIFEPFVQVNRGVSVPYEGTGLGLAISRDLARGMGGDLTVESREGVGSTFTLTLRKGEP